VDKNGLFRRPSRVNNYGVGDVSRDCGIRYSSEGIAQAIDTKFMEDPDLGESKKEFLASQHTEQTKVPYNPKQ